MKGFLERRKLFQNRLAFRDCRMHSVRLCRLVVAITIWVSQVDLKIARV
jgi:hypothetical protein